MRPHRLIPLLDWGRRYDRRWLAGDVTAGVLVAVVLVPQSLAYAALAGMPPITGLYAAVGAVPFYAALGTSPHVSVGPSAITALLVASSLAPLGADPPRYVAAAALLAVLTGVLRIAMGALRLGLLSSFVSQPVLTGFTTGAAVVIGVSQLRDLLGMQGAGGGPSLPALVRGIAAAEVRGHLLTVALSVLFVATLIVLRRLSRRFPAPLLVVVLATLLGWVLALDARGVAVVGAIPAGVPLPRLPPADLGLAVQLLPAAVTLALVGYIEAVSVASALAVRSRTALRPNQELLAVGWASVGAGLVQGFPVGGSFSRTVVSYEAGARTPGYGFACAGVLVLVLLGFAPLLAWLPRAALAAIVVVALGSLIRPAELGRAMRVSRSDAVSLVITFAATVLLPVQYGLLAGMGASLAGFLARHTRPHIAVLGRLTGTPGAYRKLGRDDVEPVAGVAILRMDGPLVFMSSRAFAERVRRVWSAQGVAAVIVDASAMTGLDATGAETLLALADDADAAGLELHFATIRGPLRMTAERIGLFRRIGPDRVHEDVDAALEALRPRQELPGA